MTPLARQLKMIEPWALPKSQDLRRGFRSTSLLRDPKKKPVRLLRAAIGYILHHGR